MVTIKDGCGCDPCDCDWKQKLKEAYARASVSVNKVGDYDGSVYFPDGSGFVKLPIPKLSEVQQISTNAQDIADLKVTDIRLQADINAETTAREEAISAEASAREAGITAEASARKTAINAEASARETAINAEASARESKDAELDSAIARIDNTDAGQDQRIQDNADKITSTYNDLVATEANVATHNSEIITLQANDQALTKSLVSDVIMTDGTTAGSVQVSIERKDGTLITSANYRWGKDIGIRLEAGTQAGYVKAVISLSDGTELVSNEYKIVEVLESDVYVTAITLVPDMTAGTIGGNISYSNGTTQTINSVNVPTAPGVTSAIEALQGRMAAVEQKNANQDASITAIDGRVQALENTPGIGQFANGRLGTIAGSTTDGRIKAEDDGTGSVNGWSALNQRVTTAEGQIVTAQENISSLNGRVGTHDTEISGIMSDITAIKTKNTQQDTAVNGKISIAQGSANAGKALIVGSDGNVAPGEISGGEVWEELDLSNMPTDFADGDRIKFQPVQIGVKTTPSSWSTAPTTVTIEKNNSLTSSAINESIIGAIGYFKTPSNFNICDADSSYVTFLKWIIGSASNWNNGSLFMNLYVYVFNGAGGKIASVNIDSNNLSSYIAKMWRLKQS